MNAMVDDALKYERKLLDRLSYALLRGRGIDEARRALLSFYKSIGL